MAKNNMFCLRIFWWTRILPESPPAYHACTIAPDMGLQFLSSTYPSTVIFLSGVNSPDGASVFTFGAPFYKYTIFIRFA